MYNCFKKSVESRNVNVGRNFNVGRNGVSEVPGTNAPDDAAPPTFCGESGASVAGDPGAFPSYLLTAAGEYTPPVVPKGGPTLKARLVWGSS